MLYLNTGTGPRAPIETHAHGSPALAGAVWLDLVRPDDAERSAAERATGLRVPARADLEEIELSSRLGVEHGVLYLSTPMTYLDQDGTSRIAPLGLVLSDRHLITVRFADMPMFDTYAQRLASAGAECGSVQAFVGLLEAATDRLADVLEHVGGEFDQVSREVFRSEAVKRGADAQLRATLQTIGRAGERLSNIRDSLLGLQRIATFSADTASAWIPAEQRTRLATVRQDIASLAEYDTRLSDKLQFLLDATLGFINMEQSNGIRILTVVSVVGVPPTFIASMYGMNVKVPEYQWEYGYAWALALIVLSAVLPLIWFKRRGWI